MSTVQIPAVHDVEVVRVETLPLAHFLPGSSVLRVGDGSLASVGSGDLDPEQLVHEAQRRRCDSVMVPHDPVEPLTEAVAALFDAVGAAGLRRVVLADAHEMHPSSLALVTRCDAVTVRIHPDVRTVRGVVAEWVEALVTDSPVWVEVATCLVPGMNDGDAAIHDLGSWVLNHLGPDVPLHFCAEPTSEAGSSASLRRARSIGLGDGLRYVYTSPAADDLSATTLCPGCGERLIERRRDLVAAYRLTARGRCHACGTPVAGCFDGGWRGPTAIPLADEGPAPF